MNYNRLTLDSSKLKGLMKNFKLFIVTNNLNKYVCIIHIVYCTCIYSYYLLVYNNIVIKMIMYNFKFISFLKRTNLKRTIGKYWLIL